MLGDKKTILWAGLFIAGLLGLGLSWNWKGGVFDRDAPLISLSDEVNRYLVMEFVPKYHVNECVVKFAVNLKDKGAGYLRETDWAFISYINMQEPQIGLMHYRNISPVQNYVYFADQCARRDEIFAGMVANVEKHFGDKMSIERLPMDGSSIEGFGRLWLDSPGYDPEYWLVYHKAVRGDGEAFLRLLHLEQTADYERQHLLYALAEHYLLDGSLKDKARQGKEAAWNEIKPKFQKRQDLLIKDWIDKLQRYNAP